MSDASAPPAASRGGPESAPLVSIIVPTFNSRTTLGAALDSLAAQRERSFEVIVSDGASTDGTPELARENAPALPACTVLSRPDRGVYDAINLGIACAAGQWVLVLGSDDRLHGPGTLQQMAPWLRRAAADVVYGDVRVMGPSRLGVAPGGRHAGEMPLHRLLRGNICQQAIFYRRNLFDRLGGFDLAYPVMADWDFNLRAAFRGPMQWVDVVVADYAATGLSAQRRDLAAMRGIPEMVRREFVRRANDTTLWPHQRVLLRQADTLRRLGHWGDASRQLLSFAGLLWQRAAAHGLRWFRRG
ncbi:MAG: glycosyltransferase [Rubrivivax sp.]|nr:glycosyltransferase [Rubrivivax sp.]